MSNNLETLFDKAAQTHGHKCPSLFYGISLALAAKQSISGPLERIILEGSSKCIKDGVKTVLQDCNLHDKLLVISGSSACALSIGGTGWQRRYSISEQIRRHINQLNQKLSTEEFQIQGVSYLRGLEKGSLINEETITTEQFKHLAV